MERSRITAFAVTTAVLITAVVLIAFIYMGLGKKTQQVTFPQAAYTDNGGESSPGGNINSGLTFADITPETVQAVIKTLKRPDSYSRSMDIESYWDGGGTEFKVDTWSKNGKLRLRLSADGWNESKNILLTDTRISVWYGDKTSNVYESERDGPLADKRLYDALQMIPTYEDVLELDKADIIEAAYAQLNESWFIKVTAGDKELGYREVYYISIDTGLLEAAETYDGDTLIFKMTSGETELSAPDDSIFVIK